MSGLLAELGLGQPLELAALVAFVVVMQSVRFLLARRHKHQTFERMKIPSPSANLIDGHLYETRRQAYVKFAHKMHKQFGKTVGIYLGGDPYLLTKDLELIRQVFVSNSRIFYNRMFFYLNVDPVPDNLICQRGDRWRYMRSLLTPAFSSSKIRSVQFYRDTQQTVERLMSQLDQNKRQAGKQEETIVLDSYDRMAAVALDVIVKTAFHMDNVINFEGPLNSSGKAGSCATTSDNIKRHDVFLETVKRACRLGFNPLVELIFCFPFLDKPLTFLCNRLYFGRIIRLLFARLDYLVRRKPIAELDTEQSRVAKKLEDEKIGEVQKRRIIDSLIEVLRAKKITRSEFTGNAFVIVFAGFETTANALTFTLWLLARHPNVQRKLRNILLEKMGQLRKANSRDEQLMMDSELAELATGCEYLEMVINESLRLYPPVPGLSCRQASVDCQLANGLKIERGVNVVPSVFSIHRDKSIWGSSANEFQPERFEVLDVSQLNSAMFMPFGLGPRNCIGKALAMHEMKIVIGRLVLNYSIEPIAGQSPDKLKLCSPINITITNSERIPLRFVKLNNEL